MSRSTSRSRGSTPSAETLLAATSTHSVISLTSKGGAAPRRVDPNTIPKELSSTIQHLPRIHTSLKKEFANLPPDYGEVRRIRFLENLRPMTIFNNPVSGSGPTKIRTRNYPDPRRRNSKGSRLDTKASYQSLKAASVLGSGDSNWIQVQMEEVPDAIPGTCQWIHNQPEFDQWRSSKNDVLLLVGDLATGKSVLAKSLYQHFEKQGGTIVLPFFCRADLVNRNSVQGIFASWIYDLLSNYKSLGRYITDEIVDLPPYLSFFELWELLCDFIDDDEKRNFVFIIDSLDQCDKKSQLDLKNLLSGSSMPLHARTFITSRPLKYLNGLGSQMPRIDVDVTFLSDDIEIVLHHEIQQRGLTDLFSKELVEFVCKEIRDIVQGMFNFIGEKLNELVLLKENSDVLLSREFLHNFFTEPPKFLEDYYKSELLPKLLSNKNLLDEVASVLSVLLVTNQDSVSELELKNIFKTSRESFFEPTAGESVHNSLDFVDNVSRVCGPLIRYKKDKTGIRWLKIAHPVAKNFLVKTRDPKSIDPVTDFVARIDLEKGHSELAQACLRHLMIHSSTIFELTLSPKDLFLDYSLKNWSTHVRESHERFHDYEELLSKFFSSHFEGYEKWSDFFRLSRNEFGTGPRWWERPLPVICAIVYEGLTNVLEAAVKASDPGHAVFANSLLVNVDELDDAGRSAVLIAMHRNDFRAASKLLELGASVQISTPELPTPLHLAVSKGNRHLVASLLERGADVDVEANTEFNDKPQSALFLSVAGTTAMFKELLDSSASHRFVRSQDGWSLLHEASYHGDTDKVSHILSLNILDVDQKTTDGYTSLMVAAGVANSHDTTTLLIQSGADVNIVAEDGSTAIYEAAYHGSLRNVVLLRQKGSVSEVGKNGETHLMAAISKGHNDIVRHLISQKVSINVQSPSGETALMFAVRYQHSNFVQQLLRAGADTTAVNAAGDTALLIASSGTRPEIVQSLLRYSPNRSEASKWNRSSWSCLHEAAFWGRLEIVKRLIEVRESSGDIEENFTLRQWTPLLAALRGRHDDVARYLLECGAKTDVKSDTGWTALHMVCFYSSDENLLLEILRRSPKSYLSAVTDKGSTPLSLAAEEGHAGMVRVLMAKPGVRTVIRNNLGNTPLHYAADIGSNETVKTLMESAFEADIRSHFGWTALHAACKRCSREVVEKLVKVTNWAFKYRQGLTPLHVAIENGNDEAFFALLDAELPATIASGWGSPPLLHAAAAGEKRYVDHLLLLQADVDSFNWVNYLPINGAYSCRDAAMMKILRPSRNLALRLSINTLDSLVNAAASISLDEVEWAVKQGMRISTRNAIHETPLSRACENGLVDVVKYLLELDAEDIWLQKEAEILLTGWTPLHIAARFRQAECISVLARDGYSDPFVEDCFGFTAFDYAHGDVPSWLSLVKYHDIPVDHYVPRHKYIGRENQIDIKQLLSIVEWRLSKLHDFNNQFDEADAHLASFVLVDPLLRLLDEQNALTAIEIYLGEPSFRLNAGISCQICAKTRNAVVFVCKSCPFRLLCNDCKDMTESAKLKGCFRHNFVKVPSDSWFSRDVRHVNDNQETEEQWLLSVQKKYEARNQEHRDDITCPPLNLGPTCKAADVFNRCSRSTLTRLIDHLHEHPRDISVKDDKGRNITMHILEIATADESCLHHLQTLATEGAKLLIFDNHKISSIKLASDRGFERSLTFLLEQWDPDFDRSEDPFSSRTVQTMIEYGWTKALNLAIERHFDWIAREKYHYLRQLSGMGINTETMVKKLKCEAAESKITTPARESDGPWAYFEPPIARNEPQLEGHVSNCIHSIIKSQINPWNDVPDVAPVPGLVADDGTYESKWGDYDRKQGLKSYWQIHKPGLGGSTGERPSTPSDFSDISRTQDFDRSFAFIDMIQEATALCGIGGLFPDSDPSVQFPETDDQIFDRELVISYQTRSDDQTVDHGKCINILKRGGQGLRSAFARAQDAQLCCSGFSILHKTELSTAECHPIVKLVDIPLALAASFVSELNKLNASMAEDGPESCANLAKTILAIPLSVGQVEAQSFESPIHWCAVALQFLCLGFVSFLMGHRSSSPIPILATHVSAFRIVGTEQGFGLNLAPVKMACVGDMLEDNLYVFSMMVDVENQSQEVAADTESAAYLLAKVEDMLEIWGPPVCIPERNSDGEPTGSILAVEICNGQLTLTGDSYDGTRCAHWKPLWEESDNDKPHEAFLVSEEVLVGILEENGSCKFNFEYEWLRAYEDQLLTPLLTRPDRWVVIQRTTQASLSGPHVAASASQTWGLERGLPMKRNVVRQWERGTGNLSMLNKPFGVVVSLCTGFAERVPLRVAIAQVMEAYLAQFTPPQATLVLSDKEMQLAQNELFGYLTGIGCRYTWQGNNQFSYYIHRVQRQRQWGYVRELILFILIHLEASGYERHRRVFRIAWADGRDAGNCFELQCTGPQDFRWLRMMEDNFRSATFAVATRLCLVAHRYPQAPYGSETCLQRPRIRQAAPHPFGIHLLHTIVVPYDATAFVRRTWPLRRGVWYKIRGEAEVVKSRLSLLQPRHADRPMLFLLVIEATDHLTNPMDSVMSVLDRREYVLEKNHEEFRGSSTDGIHIIRWADWEGRDDIGDDIF